MDVMYFRQDPLRYTCIAVTRAGQAWLGGKTGRLYLHRSVLMNVS